MKTVRNYTIIAILALLLTSGLAAQASAMNLSTQWALGNNALSLENTFLGTGSVTTENFESFALHTGADTPLNVAFGTLTSTTPGTGYVGGPTSIQAGTGEYAAPGGTQFFSNGKVTSTTGKGGFIFNFNTGMTSIGFYGIDFHDVGGQVNVTVAGAGGSQTLNIFNDIGAQANGSLLYYIIQSDTPFLSLEFHQAGGDGYVIDNLSATAAVPIPGAIWLLGSGLLGLLGVNRKRKA